MRLQFALVVHGQSLVKPGGKPSVRTEGCLVNHEVRQLVNQGPLSPFTPVGRNAYCDRTELGVGNAPRPLLRKYHGSSKILGRGIDVNPDRSLRISADLVHQPDHTLFTDSHQSFSKGVVTQIPEEGNLATLGIARVRLRTPAGQATPVITVVIKTHRLWRGLEPVPLSILDHPPVADLSARRQTRLPHVPHPGGLYHDGRREIRPALADNLCVLHLVDDITESDIDDIGGTMSFDGERRLLRKVLLNSDINDDDSVLCALRQLFEMTPEIAGT